jgi:hypothetical protein
VVAAFLPLLAASAAVLTPQHADLAVLKAFKAACFVVPDFDRIGAAAEKAGWVWVPAASQPNLDMLITKGREATEALVPDAKIAGSQYRGSFGGRTVYLIVSRYQDKDGAWSNGCRVYDFDATAPMPLATLIKWMKRPNTGTLPLPGGITKYRWEPGWKPGRTVESSFVPGDDPISQQFGLKGQVLTAQAIGGF